MKGLYPMLIIYPEGGTSNGQQLLEFKKGGFASLLPVRPIVFKYQSNYIDQEQSIIPMYAHILFIFSMPYTNVRVIDLPTFEPNEYFFKNH